VRVYPKLPADEGEARIEYARLVAENAAGKLTVSVGRAASLTEVARAWLVEVGHPKHGLRLGTLTAYGPRVKAIGGWYGDVAIERVTPADVGEFLDDLDDAYSANYARDIRTVLGQVLGFAVDRGIISTSPMPTRRRKRNSSGTGVERLTIGQAERVIEHLAEPVRSMAEVALLTGLRRGELVGLRGRNVELDAARIRVSDQVTRHGRGEPKTAGSARVVPLSPRAVEVLRPLVREHDDPIFEVSYRDAGEVLREGMIAAGLYVEGRGWHAFRHANAALRDLAGESLRNAAARLGHGARYAQTLAYGWSDEAGSASPLDAARRQARGERRAAAIASRRREPSSIDSSIAPAATAFARSESLTS
jgi:integrase